MLDQLQRAWAWSDLSSCAVARYLSAKADESRPVREGPCGLPHAAGRRCRPSSARRREPEARPFPCPFSQAGGKPGPRPLAPSTRRKQGSDQRSWVPPVMKTGRGATSAMSSCWSTGSWSQCPAYFRKLPAIQWYSPEPQTLSTDSPTSCRWSFAPHSPEQLE